MTFNEFMLSTAYSSRVHAYPFHRGQRLEGLTLNPSSYFRSAAPEVRAFVDQYKRWTVHGIRIEMLDDQPTLCVTLHDETGGGL